jgi:hypothetical protein
MDSAGTRSKRPFLNQTCNQNKRYEPSSALTSTIPILPNPPSSSRPPSSPFPNSPPPNSPPLSSPSRNCLPIFSALRKPELQKRHAAPPAAPAKLSAKPLRTRATPSPVKVSANTNAALTTRSSEPLKKRKLAGPRKMQSGESK